MVTGTLQVVDITVYICYCHGNDRTAAAHLAKNKAGGRRSVLTEAIPHASLPTTLPVTEGTGELHPDTVIGAGQVNVGGSYIAHRYCSHANRSVS
jgi:hypothetical protein